MSEPRYVITREQLVELIALCCAHTIREVRGDPLAADEHLVASNRALEVVGVRDLEEFNEECGAALVAILPDEL